MLSSMDEIIKVCGCGRSYTREKWDALHRLPNWTYEWGEVQEVRNCVCGSTIVLVVDLGQLEAESTTPSKLDQTSFSTFSPTPS
jgi:hypothetical protein